MQKKQNQIAEELGISKSYLSMILSGQRKCPSELAERLQTILNVHKVHKTEAGLSLRGRCPKPLDECAVQLSEQSIEDVSLIRHTEIE